MILQALVKYYEAMAQQEKIPKLGWCDAKISYALNLDAAGCLVGVIPQKEESARGKKTVWLPRIMKQPEAVSRSSGVAAQFLWDKASYMLGVDNTGKPARTKQCFEACARLHKEILGNVDNTFAKAICLYFDTWQPEQAEENEFLKPYLEDIYQNANLCFIMDGSFPEQEDAIVQAWDSRKNSRGSSEDEGICLVTGKKTAIARLHPMIKGVRGAQSSGAAIVSFNSSSYESYGHDKAQGLNAPVGKYAAFAYTTALNNLLSSEHNHTIIGDTTVVYWAETAEDVYADTFDIFNSYDDVDEVMEDALKKLTAGLPVDCEGITLEPNTKFYILGLAPNAARLAVRFFFKDSFGNILKNVMAHYERLKIVKADFERFENLPIWVLLQETANKNARDKSASPILAGSVYRSIISNTPYPELLLQNTVLRARADRDNPEKNIKKINRVKAAIIKACLSKNHKNMEEVAVVSVNEESKNVAYILGRLFSVLEEIQENANSGINSTIKDRYFNSACATPAVVFPLLFRLSNSHLRKLIGNKRRALEEKVTKLVNAIEMRENPIPAHFDLTNQGVFILGYYHQNQSRYRNKGDK